MSNQSVTPNINIIDNVAFLLGKSNQLKDHLLDKHLMSEEITSTQIKILFHLKFVKNVQAVRELNDSHYNKICVKKEKRRKWGRGELTDSIH